MTKSISMCDDNAVEAGMGQDVVVMAEVVDGGFPVDCRQYLECTSVYLTRRQPKELVLCRGQNQAC